MNPVLLAPPSAAERADFCARFRDPAGDYAFGRLAQFHVRSAAA